MQKQMRQQCILGFHECAGYFIVTVEKLERFYYSKNLNYCK